MNLKLVVFLCNIYFKLFSNKTICKRRPLNKKQINIEYRKMPVYSELAV